MTTELAPIFDPWPIVMGPSSFAPEPIVTLSSTVVGNPGHPVRIEGRRPEGPDADWAHLPDPVADAVQAMSARIAQLERRIVELEGEEGAEPVAAVTPLRRRQGPSPAGG